MGDIYGIIDGVELGLGRAVVSKHLLKGRKLKIVPGYKKHIQPVILHYYDRPYFSNLFKEILSQISTLTND